MGTDGGLQHAVTVVDDLIFDSTQEVALKLNKESFDWICSDGGCSDVYAVYRFNQKTKKCKTYTRLCKSNW